MEDEINLLDYWRVMVKRKRLILVLVLISAFSALVSSLKQPKLYKATATVMLVDSGGGGLASALSAMPFFSGGGAGRGSETQLVAVLKSAALSKQVVANLDLNKIFPKLPEGLSEEDKIMRAAGSLRGAIEAKSFEGLLNISVIWSNPKYPAEIANCYVEQLGRFLSNRAMNINYQVIDPAVSPIASFNRSRNKLINNALIGAMIGLVGGIFLACFLEYLEKIPH